MQILNRPKCHNFDRCNNEALSLVSGMWVCGECLVKLQDKLRILKEKLILEE